MNFIICSLSASHRFSAWNSLPPAFFGLEIIWLNDTDIIVHFDTGAEGDYLAHVTFFARAKRVRSHMS